MNVTPQYLKKIYNTYHEAGQYFYPKNLEEKRLFQRIDEFDYNFNEMLKSLNTALSQNSEKPQKFEKYISSCIFSYLEKLSKQHCIEYF